MTLRFVIALINQHDDDDDKIKMCHFNCRTVSRPMPKVGLRIFPFWIPHFFVWTPNFGWILHALKFKNELQEMSFYINNYRSC